MEAVEIFYFEELQGERCKTVNIQQDIKSRYKMSAKAPILQMMSCEDFNG